MQHMISPSTSWQILRINNFVSLALVFVASCVWLFLLDFTILSFRLNKHTCTHTHTTCGNIIAKCQSDWVRMRHRISRQLIQGQAVCQCCMYYNEGLAVHGLKYYGYCNFAINSFFIGKVKPCAVAINVFM